MKNKELAAKYFKDNPSEKECYCTGDGNVFKSKSFADLHANTGSKKKLKVETFHNSKLSVVADDNAGGSKPSAEERVEAINKLETVDAVKEALKGEKAKSVKKAGEAKIKALEEAAIAAAKKGNNGTNPPETRDDAKDDKSKKATK